MDEIQFLVIGALQANHVSDDMCDLTCSLFAYYYYLIFYYFILSVARIYCDMHGSMQ